MTNNGTENRTTGGVGKAMAAFGLALGLATPAQAAIEISISDGSNTLVCEDTTVAFTGCTVASGTVSDTIFQPVSPGTPPTVPGPDGNGFLGDSDSESLEIIANASGLGDWTAIQFSASGAIGGGNTLNSIRTFTAESSGTTSLTVKLTQFDLVATGDSFDLEQMIAFANIGDLALNEDETDANVDFMLYADLDNNKFGEGQLVYDSTGLAASGGALVHLEGAVDLSSISVGDQYSLTQVFQINHFPGGPNNKRTTTFASSTVTPVPEPAVLGLLGLGLVLTALGRRKV